MTVAGRLQIDVCRGPEGSARIVSSRPHAITRLFTGRTSGEIARLVPTLFSVCRMAQAATATSVCETALGILPSAGTAQVRELLVLAETAREHLVRILMDWPRFLGCAPDRAVPRRVMMLDRKLRSALDRDGTAFAIAGKPHVDRDALTNTLGDLEMLLEAEVFAGPAAQWLDRASLDDLLAWSNGAATPAQRLLHRGLEEGWWASGSIEVDPLPEIDRVCLAGPLLAEDADAFTRLPTWNGRPRETTPLVRQAEHPLVQACRDGAGFGLGARLAARLVELAALPGRMAALAATLTTEEAASSSVGRTAGNGRAIVQTEAARGRLAHAIEIDRGIVTRYRILAPTEWNFHPSGSAARGLAKLACASTGDTRRLAELMITALDPCVGYELKVQ
ncbi:MAG: Ni,Fe-hydrogenase I large subunit [Hyphomicrobiaceae bacterium]|nr:MAG: Ni,Fe-hydrogenase I large subunit [Hyphomicrobiaceae bacterium]